jgi:hypothetical protein
MTAADSDSWHVHNMLRSLLDTSHIHLLLNFSSSLGTVSLRASTALTVWYKSQKFVGRRDVGQKRVEYSEVVFLDRN